MTETVPILSIVFMVLALAIAVALPVGLCLWLRRRKHADLLPFFIGCAVMILFAFVLEALVHRLVLRTEVGAAIQGNLWLYGLYGGAMAGLFEETGRFIAFKTVLRKKQGRDANALMYGAGHGGIEALAILGIASLNNLLYSVLINTGNTALLTAQASGEVLEQVEGAIRALAATPSWQFLLGGVERIFAVVLHLSFSVLVWFAAKKKNRIWLYPAAVLLHLIVDAATAILAGKHVSLLLVEAAVAALALLSALIAKKVWRDNAVTGPDPADDAP
jgi:uncharacterized membrane protein YhfC